MTQEQKQNYERIYKLVIDLQKEHWPYEGEQDKNQALSQVINFAQSSLDKTLDPTDLKNFLQRVAKEILKELSKPLEQEAPSIPQNLKDLVAEMDEARAREEARREKLMAEAPRKTYNYFLNLNEKIISQIYPESPPTAIKEASREITKDIVDKIPAVARPDLLKPEDYKQAIDKNLIAEKLKNAGLEPKENISEKFLENFDAVKKIAAEPEIVKSIKEERLTTEKTSLSDKVPPLPQEILVKLNQPPETVTFLPIYTIFHPKVGVAFIRKVTNAVPAYFVKLAVENAPPDWQASKGWPIIQEMVGKRIFIEDLQASVKALKEMGVPDNHPLIQKFEDRIAKFLEVQKNPKTNKDYPWVTVLKRDSFWDKFTGRKRIEDEDLGYLPRLSPNLAWSRGGYADFLRKGLNRFRFVVNIYERFSKFVTGGKHTSFFVPIRQFFSQKVTQPVVRWLAKTAVGKAVKAGAKKAAVWLATRLGVEVGATAAGLAAGGVPGIVVAAVSVVWEALKFIGKKFADLIRKIVQKPENALVTAGVGALVLIFVPMPFALIGIAPLVLGGMGLASFALAPTTLSVVGGGITAFFTAISTLPFTAPIALFIVILFSTLAVLTLFIVMVVSGAFILPKPIQEAAIKTVSPYTSEFFDVTKTVSPKNEYKNEELPIKVTYIVTIKPKNGHTLIRPKIVEDKFIITKEGSIPLISPCGFEDLPETITSPEILTCEKTFDSQFKDSAISNTISVTTEIQNQTGVHFLTATETVVIGNPPMECPSGYPTEHGQVSQGPFGATSHRFGSSVDPNSHDQIAIDITTVPGIISFSNNIAVKATHNGTLKKMGCSGYSGCGVYIYSPCGSSKNFYTAYWHLLNEGRYADGRVDKGDIIGYTNGWQNHLHYEFGPQGPQEWPTNWRPPIEMKPPYFPQNVPYFCSYCGIKW